MTDDEIRQLIRDAIARHLGPQPAAPPGGPTAAAPSVPIAFSRYRVTRVPEDTMCLIEPAVRCNHCGYCECHGH